MRKLLSFIAIVLIALSCNKDIDVLKPSTEQLQPSKTEQILKEIQAQGFYQGVQPHELRSLSLKETSTPEDLEQFLTGDEFVEIFFTSSIEVVAEKAINLPSYNLLSQESKTLFQETFKDIKTQSIISESLNLILKRKESLRNMHYGQFYNASAAAGMSPSEKKRLMKTIGRGAAGYLGGPLSGAITMVWSFIDEYL